MALITFEYGEKTKEELKEIANNLPKGTALCIEYPPYDGVPKRPSEGREKEFKGNNVDYREMMQKSRKENNYV